MAQSKLQIILEAVYKGQGIRKAKEDLSSLEQASTKAKSTWASMAPAIAGIGVAVGGVAVAARGAWQALEGGAALLETERKFDRLAASIGTTGDALRNELGDAVGLLMTQGEQMGLATDLMSLGLAKTSDEAVRLGRVVGELGMDLGQLALTLTNQTTMRFDQMGMRVDGFAEKVEKLKDVGYSADEAFKWAFIEQAEEQVELLGGRSETTAGQLEMLKNATQQAWETFQMEFASGAVSQLGDIESQAQDTAEQLSIVAGFIGQLGGLGVGIASGLISSAGAAFGFMGDLFSGPVDTMKWDAKSGRYVSPNNAINTVTAGYRAGYPGGAGASTTIGTTAEIERQITGTMNNQRALRGMADAAMYAAQGQRLLADESENASGRIGGGFVSALDQADAAMQQLASTSGDYFSMLRNAKEFNLFEEVFKIGDRFGWSAGEMADFGVAAGLFDQGRANELMNQTYLLQYAEQLMNQGIGGGQLAEMLKGMQQQLAEGGTLAQEFFGNLDEQTAEFGVNLDTLMALEQRDLLLADLESKPAKIPVVLDYSNDAVARAVRETTETNRIKSRAGE